MTLQTNHLRYDETAHLWPDGAGKGDEALCGREWTNRFGTLVTLSQAGYGDTLPEALDDARMCMECRRAAIEYLNLPPRAKRGAREWS